VRRCRAYGTERSGGISCGVLDDAKSQLPSRPLILSSGGNVGDPSTAIEVSDSTAFVVLEAAGQRFVQQPVAGITLFIWQLDGSSGRVDLIARAYDSDGQTLGCVASGSGVC
jgi:hypothetical protein